MDVCCKCAESVFQCDRVLQLKLICKLFHKIYGFESIRDGFMVLTQLGIDSALVQVGAGEFSCCYQWVLFLEPQSTPEVLKRSVWLCGFLVVAAEVVKRQGK